jgi:hypothetical protein
MRPLLAPFGLLLALLAAPSAPAALVQGGARGERLVGTARADVIVARGGADRVLARGGNDRIAVQYDGARDTVACGPGRDVVNADGADVVAADCEVASRRLSHDIHATADAQHETQVEPDSFTWGRTTVAVFQTGRRHNGAASNLAWATSTDDGRTWRRGEVPGLTPVSPRPGTSAAVSDPVVAYSAVHRVWLISGLAVPDPTRLTINRSADGLVWSDPVDAASAPIVGNAVAFDKQWLTCDNGAASRFRGRCYLVFNDWVRRAMSVITSVDGGLTWSQPTTMPFAPFLLGGFPVVRPDGTLVILVRVGSEERTLGAVRSLDGGVTLEPPVTVAPLRVARLGIRAVDIPSADVDPNGRIWVAWHSCARLPTCNRNEVLVADSGDGVTWSEPVAVGAATNGAMPALAAGPRGRLAVLYYTQDGSGVNAQLVESRDGGLRWTAPQRLSAVSMPLR